MRKFTIGFAALLCVCIYGMFITKVNNRELHGEGVDLSLEGFREIYSRFMVDDDVVDILDKESVESILQECVECGIEEEVLVTTTSKVTTKPKTTTTSRPVTTTPLVTTTPVTTTTTPITTTVTTITSTPSQVTGVAREIFDLVNEERTKVGKKAYILDDALCSIANMRAKELVSKFSHTRPSGKSFSTALSEAGYGYTSVSENIAYGYSSAVSVMDKWMSSSAHKGNILDSQDIGYSKIGIGYYNSNGTKYYVQIFVK